MNLALRRLAGPLLCLSLLAACGGEQEPRLVRLERLVTGSAAPQSPPVELVTALEVGSEPATVSIDLDAARTVRLSLVARGDAPMLEMSWRLANENRFKPYRKLSLPLQADGEEHRYEIDLARESYWVTRVADLRFAVAEGRVEILSLIGDSSTAGPRTTALQGVSVPSLPGLERIEIELPEGLPGRTVLETRMGILPKLARPGTAARFRAYLVSGGDEAGRQLLLERTLTGETAEGWSDARVELPAGSSGVLTLEVSASREGELLAEGSAVWGGPRLVAPSGGPARGGSRASKIRNVVMVVIDTLRADAVGAYGDSSRVTPHLDALAAGAIRFDQLLAPAPWTLPSVASLITGHPPQVHGTGRHFGDFAPSGLGPSPTTLAEVLSRAGFYSVGIYNNIYLLPSFGVDRGFDEYGGHEEGDDALVDRAIAALERYGDRRLFLFLHLFGPHNPYEATAADCAGVVRARLPGYAGALGCSADRRPGLEVPPREDWEWIEALYHGDVTFTDRQVGRLVAALDRKGIAEETLLLVVSDHGEDFWGRWAEIEGRGYEDADHGHSLFGEVIRVPGILSFPGARPTVIAEPVELIDFYPTVLSLLGLEGPPTEGVDLAPLLTGEGSRTAASRRVFLAESLLYGPQRWSVRKGPWKLIVPEDETLPRELYNLAADPGELENLAEENPEVVRSLLEVGVSERARREAVRKEVQKGHDALQAAYLQWNHITKLRALGYLK